MKRRRDGGRKTGQTPAVEELDSPQEAEGKILSSINYTLHLFPSGLELAKITFRCHSLQGIQSSFNEKTFFV